MGLVVSDFGYWAWHILQHRFNFVYWFSHHGYHHQFKTPVALVGPWLSPVDIFISGIMTFYAPVCMVLSLFLHSTYVPFHITPTICMCIYI